MRALCGAIIAAGALIGLGLAAVGYGIRFSTFGPQVVSTRTEQLYGVPSMAVILVILILAVFVGLGTAFLGLAYHHNRRLAEHQRGVEHPRGAAEAAPGERLSV